MKKLQILMSTYNGEKYLSEQLDSIINQTVFDTIKVLIRDDGSTDNTLEILREYSKKYGFDVIEGDNVGYNRSFYELIIAADNNCQYFAISDQDDVWINKKCEIALNELENNVCDIPLLFASRSKIVNETLEYMGMSEEPKRGISFYNAAIQNITSGHTQVFNRKMRAIILENDIDDINVFDWWIQMIATSMGKVVYYNDYTVLHRQHGNNTVGYEVKLFKKIKNRITRLLNNNSNKLSLQLYYFYKCFNKHIDDELTNEIKSFFISQKNLFSRIIYIFKSKFYRQKYLETIFFYLVYILGKYNVNRSIMCQEIQ